VEGVKTFASVLDVPVRIDVATVYVPPTIGVRVLEEVARKGIPEVWLNPGADDAAMVAKGRALGLRVVVACSIIVSG